MTISGVVAMGRLCAQCGNAIPAQVGSSRPRKFCATCRPSRDRNPRKAPALEVEPTAERAALDPVSEISLEETYRRRLASAGQTETPEGVMVLHMARLLETGEHSASGVASLARELRVAAEVAMRGAGATGDLLDDLAARRTAKAAGS